MKIPGKRVGKINLVGIPGSMPKFEEKNVENSRSGVNFTKIDLGYRLFSS